MLTDIDLLPCYYPRDDSLLLAVYNEYNADRQIEKEWKG